MMLKLLPCYQEQEERNMIFMHKKDLLINKFLFVLLMIIANSCNQSTSNPEENSKMVHLITLDPGHFHEALEQKSMYDDVDSVVHGYAAPGNDVQFHLYRIKAYNYRTCDPT